jgi:hypothetical protein
LSTPAPVSQWISMTWVMLVSASSMASSAAGETCAASSKGMTVQRRPISVVSFAARLQYAPLSITSTWPSRGTTVATAASTLKVPLPCSGTTTCESCPWMTSSRLLRTLAVTALKSASQEPQSLSIASLVRKVVVSGPGVRRILSLSMGFLQSELLPLPWERFGLCLSKPCS